MIIVRIWEGLGNQMFQYAYARSLRAQGLEVRLDLRKAYDDTFEKYRNHQQRDNSIQNFRITIPEIDVNKYKKYSYLQRDKLVKKMQFWLGTHFLWKYRFYEEERQEFSLKSQRIKGNYYVKGWFQSEEYFKEIREILIKEFTPKKKIRISNKLREALEYSECVSVHVRRGDYVKIDMTIGAVYYKKAVAYIKTVYEKPLFLVFSDDLDWAKENILGDEQCILVNEERKLQDYEELFIMSRCRSNIIANSTFSWWAAWLNQNEDKHVIAPKKWSTGQGKIVPKEWMLI